MCRDLHDRAPPRATSVPALQAGGRRFDPGWLHLKNPCKEAVWLVPAEAFMQPRGKQEASKRILEDSVEVVRVHDRCAQKRGHWVSPSWPTARSIGPKAAFSSCRAVAACSRRRKRCT